MELFELGWNSDWEARLARLGPTPGGHPARVIRQDRGRYTVLGAEGLHLAAPSGRFHHLASSSEEHPAVGDWVVIEPDRHEPGSARLHAVLPRQSQFVRKVAGRSHAAQVVAANIDTVFLVTGMDENFRLRRIERYLAVAAQSGAEPVVVLNKLDLCPDPAATIAAVGEIAGPCPVVALSALAGEGLEELRAFLRPFQTAALLGSSGVGKSTLLNALAGDHRQAVQANRAEDGRGRHTTTARELFVLADGALLIDTPGMRELGLLDQGEATLGTGFEEIEALVSQCRFTNCTHETEPGCAVLAAIAAGTIGPEQLEHWRRLQRERAFAARQQDVRLQRAEAAKWKKINQQHRKREAFRRRLEEP